MLCNVHALYGGFVIVVGRFSSHFFIIGSLDLVVRLIVGSLNLVVGLIVVVLVGILDLVVGLIVVVLVVHSCGSVPVLGGAVGKIVVGGLGVVVPIRGKVAGVVRIAVIIQIGDGGAVAPGKRQIAGGIAAPPVPRC
jgi:hypothetical protein